MKTFKIRSGRGLVEVRELSKAEAAKLAVIGTAEGADEEHCLYLAMKHGYKFTDRVAGYRKTTPTQEKAKVALTFYGDPTPREWSPRKKA